SSPDRATELRLNSKYGGRGTPTNSRIRPEAPKSSARRWTAAFGNDLEWKRNYSGPAEDVQIVHQEKPIGMRNTMRMASILFAAFLLLGLAACPEHRMHAVAGAAADGGLSSKNRYNDCVRICLDRMLAYGTDRYGSVKT